MVGKLQCLTAAVQNNAKIHNFPLKCHVSCFEMLRFNRFYVLIFSRIYAKVKVICKVTIGIKTSKIYAAHLHRLNKPTKFKKY